MKTALKIIFLLVLVVLLAVVTVYSVYKDKLLEEVRVRSASKLSVLLGRGVNIGSMEYVPLQSISLGHVTVSTADDPDLTEIEANNITLTVDVLSLIKDKQLKTTITADGLRSGDILCNTMIRTASRKADAYAEVLAPSLVNSVAVIDTLIASKKFTLRNISGNLTIDDLAVSKGKICFTHNDIKYLTDFAARKPEDRGYDVSVRSENLGFQSTLIRDDDRLIVDNLTGTFYNLLFDLKGELQDYLSPEMVCSINGTVETDLATFASLPGETGQFARDHSISGKVKSHVYLKTREPDPGKCEFNSTIFANDLRMDNLRMEEITAKLSLKDGSLSTPFISGTLYDGTLTCDLKMDVAEKDLPYLLSLEINNMDFGSFMRDITGKKINVRGTLAAALALEGYAAASETARGSGKITISDADLGPMPLLTPLLGNIFSAVQNILSRARVVNISRAYTDFDIKDRKITTDNLTLQGEDIAITAKGYVDLDGNLDFAVQNQFRQPAEEDDEDWQMSLRNTIVQFGKVISKGRLTGTIKKPKWKFEYFDPIKNLINRNIRGFLGISE
ncbi:MAG: hypothetical protein DRP85_06975 [Candidatus Makaraimicrobium thalassicum]|nr:MAG: hypothetical protein DRP85_06975 [Candidatus Omnitrophota bacterium]